MIDVFRCLRALAVIALGSLLPPDTLAAGAPRLELVRVIQGVCDPFHAVAMGEDIYCAEHVPCVIKKIRPDGRYEWLGARADGALATTWQSDATQPAGCSKQLERPHTIKRRGETLEITLLGSNEVLTIDANGILGRRHFDRIKGAGLVSTADLPNGIIVAIDYRNEVIQRRQGERIDYLGCPASWFGTADGWQTQVKFAESAQDCGFARPHEVLVRGDYLYVADTGNHRIKRYRLDGRYAGWIGQTRSGNIASGWQGGGGAQISVAPGGFSEPVSMAFDERGDLYVLDYGSGRLQIISESGHFVAGFDFAGRLKHPYGLSVAADRVIVANTGGKEILVFKVHR